MHLLIPRSPKNKHNQKRLNNSFQSKNALTILSWPISYPIEKDLIEPYAPKGILDVVCGAQFGISAEELVGARIWVRHRLLLEEYFDEDFWDVTDISLSAVKPA